jgi:iron complex outermembrane recepter protein
MHLLKYTLLALLCLSGTFRVFAQPGGGATIGSITGKLVDAKNQAVPYASVTLLRSDSSVANGALSADDGSFSISPTGIGNFRLRVAAIGVATKTVNVQVTADKPNMKMGAIRLTSTENTLNEVNVTGEKPVMELKVDKKVFNVEKNTTTAGGSATDVLRNVPSVSVDESGNVSLRGNSGVTILIDGKPATMLGTDAASALQSLPASSIENVEVLTNPSAKYDASGTAGIINIITKKDGRFGMNGNITLGAGTGDKYNGNLGLNVRKGKWSVFLNSSARQNHTYNNVITDRNDKDSAAMLSYHTYEHVPRQFYGWFNTAGATYDPNKYNSLTFTQNVNVMGFGFRDFSSYHIYSQPADLGDTLSSRDKYTNFFISLFSVSSAFDYKHKFKKKDEELSVDATYAATDIRKSQEFLTNGYSYMPGPSATFFNSHEYSNGGGSNSSFNAWADYTDPLFTKNGKLGLGFKSQFYWFNSHSNPVIDVPGRPEIIDTALLSDFNYSQQTHAAYANWSDQVGKFSYQAGLRFEDAIYDGNGRVPVDTTFHNSFANLFPSAFVSYQLPNQQSIYLNYTRRVNRPGFMQLLPFKDFSNPGTVNMGNPNLIPEFINNIEFSYNKTDTKGNNIILSAYYAYTENLTQRVPRLITGSKADTSLGLQDYKGTLLSQPINIASGITKGLEGTAHLQILPIWDATLNVNFFQNELKVGSIDTAYSNYLTNSTGNSWFGKVNTNLKLPKNFSLQVNANYESPKVIAQGSLKETYWIDVALRKNFWKNKATLVLNCSDIFNTHQLITIYNLTSYSETINRVRETRIGNITFTYRFGKQDKGAGAPGGMGGRRDRSQESKGKPAKPSDEDREKNLKEGDDNDQQGGGMPGGGQRKEGGGGSK